MGNKQLPTIGGMTPAYHFAGAGKMIGLGSGSQRQLDDYQLSRFTCYLIAQNGEQIPPAKTNNTVSQTVTNG